MYALGLDLCLLFIPPYDPGPGVEVVHPGRHLSGCFAEALFAAVYLDQGLEACRGLVERLILPRAEILIAAFVDPKGDLQTLLHARFRATPTYVTMQEGGPQFDKVFRVACLVGDVLLATGEARRKREAQRLAAQRALETVADWERRLPTPAPSVPVLAARDG